MKIVSYSKTNNDINGGGAGGGSGSSGSSEIQNPTGTRGELDRTIWGQTDVGDDIDGTMKVNGDVYIKVIEEKNYEPDDEEDEGDDVEYETGGGSLFVDLKVSAKNIEAVEDISVGRHLYIKYPAHPEHPADNKKCLGEILYSMDSYISTNKSEISSLKGRMDSAETAIESLDANIQICEQSIRNNADEIVVLKNRTTQTETDNSGLAEEVENLKDRTDKTENDIVDIKEQMADGSAIDNLMRQVESLKYGNYSNPVILYSGVLRKLSTSDIYTNNGSYKDCILFTIKEIKSGVMTIELSKSGDRNINIFVTSISAIQQMSNDTEERKDYYKERSNGAHWFEAWVGETLTNKTTIYLREMHNGNDDNDTWYSSSWTESGGIRAVNLTISGYISFVS